jgi:hypothetical protein
MAGIGLPDVGAGVAGVATLSSAQREEDAMRETVINIAGSDHPLNECRACGGVLVVYEFDHQDIQLYRTVCDGCYAMSPITTGPASAVRWYLFLTRKLRGV